MADSMIAPASVTDDLTESTKIFDQTGVIPIPRTSSISIELANDYLVWSWSEGKQSKGLQTRILIDPRMHEQSTALSYIQQLTALNSDRRTSIHFYLSISDAILRSYFVPAVPHGELQQVALWEAGKVFPFQPTAELFSWRVTESLVWGGVKKHQIQATAVPPGRVEAICDYLASHFEVKSLTLWSLAWESCLARLIKRNASAAGKSVAIVRLFGDRLSVLCYYRAALEFIRDSELDGAVTGDEFDNSLSLLQDRQEHKADFNIYRGFDFTALARLVAEELDYYYGRFSQRSVETIYLAVPAAIEKETREALNSMLGIQVESLASANPNWEDATPGCRHLLAPTKPHGFGRGKTLDLLPKSFRRAVTERRNFRLALIAACVVVLLVAAVSIAQVVKERQSASSRDELQQSLDQLRTSPVYTALITLQEQGATWRTQLDQLRGSNAKHSQFLRALSALTPDNIYLSELELQLTTTEQGSMIAGVSLNGFVSGSEQYPEVLLSRYIRDFRDQRFVQKATLQNQFNETLNGQQRLRFTVVLEVLP